jgi:sRNA-binding protein
MGPRYEKADSIDACRGLNAYTHSTTYWLTLTAGTPRINLNGNLAGEVTLKEEEHAKRKIAKAVRRAAAKAPGQPAAGPVEKCAEQLTRLWTQKLNR